MTDTGKTPNARRWITGRAAGVLVHGVIMDHRMWMRRSRLDARVICLDMLATNLPGEHTLADATARWTHCRILWGAAGPRRVFDGGLITRHGAAHHADLAGLAILRRPSLAGRSGRGAGVLEDDGAEGARRPSRRPRPLFGDDEVMTKV